MATKTPDTSISLGSLVSTLQDAHFFHGLLVHVVDFLDHVRREKLNFLVGVRAIQHDLGGAKFVAAMQQRDFARKSREERGFLHGGVAAADHHDFLAAEKEAVAGGAGGNAVAQQLRAPIRSPACAPKRRPQ